MQGHEVHVGEIVGGAHDRIEVPGTAQHYGAEWACGEQGRGSGPLVGRQLRYLIGSEYGWLGGLGFAAAALHLAARDRWIGWDLERRRAHLDMVVGMSRFLIRSSVRCRNLASRVLGLAVKRMPDDFEARYGYRPLLVETFVDSERFAGTCYRAANWLSVGETQGRGRQDREVATDRSVKEVFVHPPLCANVGETTRRLKISVVTS